MEIIYFGDHGQVPPLVTPSTYHWNYYENINSESWA